jgi:hypothetical protein
MTSDEATDLMIANGCSTTSRRRVSSSSALPKASMGRCWAPGAQTNGQTPSISTGLAGAAMRCASAEPPWSYRAARWSNAVLPAAR